jgi:parvulin-like peptidyl-prolyl isomerase
MQKNEVDNAISNFKLAVKLEPNFFDAIIELGMTYGVKENFEEAINQFNRAIKLNPNLPDAYTGIGGIHYNQKNFIEAEKYLKKAISLNQSAGKAHYMLGRVYYDKGNLESALKEFKIANKVEPSFTPSKDWLDFTMKESENIEKAIKAGALRVRHILVNTKEEADAIKNELKNGSDFAELAKKKSIDKSSGDRGGDTGFFSQGDMVPEFEEAVMKLKVGEISEPVKTRLGYHIILRLN